MLERDTEYGFTGIHFEVDGDGELSNEQAGALAALGRKLMIGRQVSLLDRWLDDDYDEVDRFIWTLDDGTTIESISNGPVNTLVIRVPTTTDEGAEEEIIIILYLESGYIDARPIASAGDEFPIRAGLVYWPSSLITYLSTDPCWMDQYQLEPFLRENNCDARSYDTDGLDSLSLVEVPDTSTLNPKEGKRYYGKIRPWLGCTGKASLLVQALLGRIPIVEPSDDDAQEDPGHRHPILDSMDWNVTQRLGSSHPQDVTLNNCAGLLTTADYEYFYFRFTPSSPVEIVHLEPETQAVLLHEAMKRGEFTGDQLTRAETYLLGHMEFGDSALIDNPNTDIEGDPFCYGWHFNWDGDEATVVTYEAVYDGDTLQYYTMRRYTLTVGGDQLPGSDGDGTDISMVVTEDEEVNATFRGADLIWFPAKTFLAEMQVLFELVYPELIYDVTAPVYSYYGWDDDGIEQLRIVTHEITEGESAETENDYATARLVELCGLGSVDIVGRTFTDGDSGGFTIDGVYEAVTDSGEGQEFEATLTTELRGYTNQFVASSTSNDFPSHVRSCAAGGRVGYNGTGHGGVSQAGNMIQDYLDIGSGADWSGKNLCIIAFENADSVYLAARTQKRLPGVRRYRLFARMVLDIVSYKNPTVIPGATIHLGTHTARLAINGTDPIGGWLYGPDPGTNDTSDTVVDETTATIDFRVFGKRLNHIVYQDEVEVDGLPTQNEHNFNYTGLFDPTIDTQTYSKMIITREGIINGDAYYFEGQEAPGEPVDRYKSTDNNLLIDYDFAEHIPYAGWCAGFL